MAKRSRFWIALLHDISDQAQRAHLWNGYLGSKLPANLKVERSRQTGWPRYFVNAPLGGWPELTQAERHSLDDLANANDGHPHFGNGHYMDCSNNLFVTDVDLSDLIFVDADFSKTQFQGSVKLNKGNRFEMQSWFMGTHFVGHLHCWDAQFDADVHFGGARFMSGATFVRTRFNGGVDFTDAVFERDTMFNESKFGETYFGDSAMVPYLANFKRTKFLGPVSWRETVFGENPKEYRTGIRPDRVADFSSAEFRAATDFRRAVFRGPPAFFDSLLHEDTDFGGVTWTITGPEPRHAAYAIRAWERLELMMSRLEKPLDRHHFYRLKMRARRRVEGRFARALSWLFDVTTDYGWSISRALTTWLAHWIAGGLLLVLNSSMSALVEEGRTLILAAFATSFFQRPRIPVVGWAGRLP